jgi:asparagine synthetase B (glutamine-hydrolysing)
MPVTARSGGAGVSVQGPCPRGDERRMRGLTALFKQRDLVRPLSLARVMSNRVAHRRPDDPGIVGLEDATLIRSVESIEWQVALAHRRLSIIDLSPAAAQPMVYRDRYWLTYNGEVYNFLELRAEPQQLGHAFRTEGDAEVVLAPFAEWGARCFERGM